MKLSRIRQHKKMDWFFTFCYIFATFCGFSADFTDSTSKRVTREPQVRWRDLINGLGKFLITDPPWAQLRNIIFSFVLSSSLDDFQMLNGMLASDVNEKYSNCSVKQRALGVFFVWLRQRQSSEGDESIRKHTKHWTNNEHNVRNETSCLVLVISLLRKTFFTLNHSLILSVNLVFILLRHSRTS